MKTMKSKFYSLALAAGMLSLTACSDDNTNDSNNDKGNGIENGSTLKGRITEDVTNNENDNAATPVSHPVLKNLILAGNGESKQTSKKE